MALIGGTSINRAKHGGALSGRFSEHTLDSLQEPVGPLLGSNKDNIIKEFCSNHILHLERDWDS